MNSRRVATSRFHLEKGDYSLTLPQVRGVGCSDDDANARNADGFRPIRPRKLYTFRDMIEFLAKDALDALANLNHLAHILFQIKKSNELEIPNKANCEDFKQRLTKAHEVAEILKMTDSLKRLNRFNQKLGVAGFNITALYTEFFELGNAFNAELNAIHFAFIPEDKLQYFEKDVPEYLFGEDVFVAFPSACETIRNAANCRATDLHAAAIYSHVHRQYWTDCTSQSFESANKKDSFGICGMANLAG